MSHHSPHIIVYHGHDTGRWIGPFGQTEIPTPHADKFASQGIVFEQAFAASPTCSPSRAAMMTGRYPHANGVMGLCHKRFAFDLNKGERHGADYFNELGYHTAAIGVIHEVRDPEKAPYQTRVPENNALEVGAALDAILEERREDKRPMFISIGTSQTHRSYPKLPATAQSSGQLPKFLFDTPETRHDFAELEVSVRQWDQGLGDVLAALQRHGLEEDSLVIVTTDHGLAMPRSKGTLYDSGTGILMMMRWPGQVEPNSRCNEMICNVDLLPTWLEVAGGTIPATLHGQSLLPLLRGKSTFQRSRLFTEHTYHGDYNPIRAIRTQRHKYIVNFFNGKHIHSPVDACEGGAFISWDKNTKHRLAPLHELYDLENDPDECLDLLIEPGEESLHLAESLRAELYRWMKDTGDPLLDGPIPNPGWRQACDWLASV
jgi:arylsulfatase A-like enzyme